MIDIGLQDEYNMLWNAQIDPVKLLKLCRHTKLSDRKSRLFGVACCRNVSSLIKDVRIRKGLWVAEEIADNGYSAKKFTRQINDAISARSVSNKVIWRIHYAATLCLMKTIDILTISGNASSFRGGRSITEERSKQCDLLRDIIGNPFSSIDRDSLLGYLTPDVVNLVNCAYFQRLPNYTLNPQCLYALSDALEEAGCASIEILDHLRQNRLTHVRGCWVVDLLLGKS